MMFPYDIPVVMEIIGISWEYHAPNGTAELSCRLSPSSSSWSFQNFGCQGGNRHVNVLQMAEDWEDILRLTHRTGII